MWSWTSKQQRCQPVNFHEVLAPRLHAMFIHRWRLGFHGGGGVKKKGGVSLCNKQTNNNNNSDNINIVIVR